MTQGRDTNVCSKHDDVVSRLLFRTPLLRIGKFRLPARHDAWNSENNIGRGHFFVFPRVPVGIHQAGDEQFVATSSEVVFYNSQQPYKRQLLCNEGDCCEWFVVREDMLREALRPYDGAAADDPVRPLRKSHGPSSPHAYMTQRLIFEHVSRQETPDALLVDEAFMGVMHDVIRDSYGGRLPASTARRASAARSRRELADETRRMIALRYTAALTLSELAEDVGVSPYHLCRIFREVVGVTLHRYQTRLRLRAALERILEGAHDLTVLALDLGFSSHSHFTNAFRQEFQVPPSRLREADLLTRLADFDAAAPPHTGL